MGDKNIFRCIGQLPLSAKWSFKPSLLWNWKMYIWNMGALLCVHPAALTNSESVSGEEQAGRSARIYPPASKWRLALPSVWQHKTRRIRSPTFPHRDGAGGNKQTSGSHSVSLLGEMLVGCTSGVVQWHQRTKREAFVWERTREPKLCAAKQRYFMYAYNQNTQ